MFAETISAKKTTRIGLQHPPVYVFHSHSLCWTHRGHARSYSSCANIVDKMGTKNNGATNETKIGWESAYLFSGNRGRENEICVACLFYWLWLWGISMMSLRVYNEYRYYDNIQWVAKFGLNINGEKSFLVWNYLKNHSTEIFEINTDFIQLV